MFVLPLYVVLSVAFGTVDFENFGIAVPYYAPWWWSFSTFNQTLSQFYVGTHIYQAPFIRTFEYVFFASAICLVLGYAVAYYTARFATKYRGLILILLVSPFWISYLMRIYAWQGLLDTNGPINWLLSPVGFGHTNFLEGKSITVVLGLVRPVHDPAALRVARPDPREHVGSRARPGRQRLADVLARHHPAVAPSHPGGHRDRHAADVR